MLHRLTFAAVLALTPAAAPAQGDGQNAIANEDGPEAWSICTMASAYLADAATDPAAQKMRADELEMLVAVAMGRFMQQGLTLDQAKERFVSFATTREPLYANGSGTDLADRGTCIRAGMVSQTGGKHADRLLAAYAALPPVLQSIPLPAPAAPPTPVVRPFVPAAPLPTLAAPPPTVAAPRPVTATPPPAVAVAPPAPVAQLPEIAFAEVDFSATLGSGENFGAVSYRINDDGTLSGFYGYKAPGVVFTETAVPRVRGQGLAGFYDASGRGSGGAYTSSFEIVEKYRLDGGALTVYHILLAIDGDTLTGTGVYAGGSSLSAVFGADMIGRFHMSEDLEGWDLYLVRDAGNTARLSQFRFEGAHFDGSHEVLADGVPQGTASFTRDAAGVIRIAMPDGSSVVAVCAPEGINTTC